MKRHPPSGSIKRARQLRSNPTEAEKALWRLLREAFPAARFRRQVPLKNYIADFASHRARLVIEVDGGQHDQVVDAKRTAEIEAQGYRVLRVWNNDILENRDGVHHVIETALNSAPPPNPLPSRGRDSERKSGEPDFLNQLRSLATHPAAQGLADDVALLGDLILTHDVIVEGVHFLPHDPPADIGWKLAAVNLSDLAAKGAEPVACLMGYTLSGDVDWDAAFLDGLGEALARYNMPLIGGDTVSVPAGSARHYGLTAIGRAGETVPVRSGAKAGDTLYVTGPVGLAGLGLKALVVGESGPAEAIAAYRRPQPHVDQGRTLAPLAHAMMDVSDGLLLDARRMAEASGLGVTITHIPIAPDVAGQGADPVETALAAASAGDDYVLLLAGPDEIGGVAGAIPIGQFTAEPGLRLILNGCEIALPDRLGYQHV